MRKIVLFTFILMLLSVCSYAKGLKISNMVLDNKVMDVIDIHQLTLRSEGDLCFACISPDGKNVAYIIEKQEISECRVIKTRGGKPTAVFTNLSNEVLSKSQKSPSGEIWTMAEYAKIIWSPDSKQFAFPVIRTTWNREVRLEQQYVLVFSANGLTKTSLFIQDHGPSINGILFSSDSRKLYIVEQPADPKSAKYKNAVLAFDISTGANQIIYASNALSLSIKGLADNGNALLCVTGSISDDNFQNLLHKIAVKGDSDQVIGDYKPVDYSPDGMFTHISYSGIAVKNEESGQQVQIIDPPASFVNWAPNSRMLLYEQSETISDASKQREETLYSLWLSSLKTTKFSSMCITRDYDYGKGLPTCSYDCRRIAYISHYQLYVAELEWRDPDPGEKLAIGLPLTEEETKKILLKNGSEIGVGLQLYWNDYDGHLPPADSVADAIYGHMGNGDAFYRPGTKENIFKYIDPGVTTESEIENQSNTVIGELDAGYNWKVLIYADTHVQIVAK